MGDQKDETSEYREISYQARQRQHAESLSKGVFRCLRELGYGPLVQHALRQEWAVIPIPQDQWADETVPFALGGELLKSILIACRIGFLDLHPHGWNRDEPDCQEALRYLPSQSLLVPRIFPKREQVGGAPGADSLRGRVWPALLGFWSPEDQVWRVRQQEVVGPTTARELRAYVPFGLR